MIWDLARGMSWSSAGRTARVIAVALLFGISIGSLAFAQTAPIDRIERSIVELQQSINKMQTTLDDQQKLLATIGRIQLGVGTNILIPSLKKDLAAIPGKMATLQGEIDKNKEATAKLSPEAAAYLDTCGKALKVQADPNANLPQLQKAKADLEASCKPEDRARALQKLDALISQLLPQWQQCRASLIKAGLSAEEDLPVDPKLLSDVQRDRFDKAWQKAQQQGQQKPQLAACSPDLPTTLRSAEEAKSEIDQLGRFLDIAFAALTCLTAVADPTTVSAVACFISLASLFDGDGGGGDGSGQGTSSGAGQQVAAQGPGKQPGPTSVGSGPLGGTFGDDTLPSGIICNREGESLRCFPPKGQESNYGPPLVIDPNNAVQGSDTELLRMIIQTPGQDYRLRLCLGTAGDLWISDIVAFRLSVKNTWLREDYRLIAGAPQRPKLEHRGSPAEVKFTVDKALSAQQACAVL